MPVPCARCSMPLPAWELASSAAAACTSCGSSNMVRAFPALFAQRTAVQADAALSGEATCFDHPSKRAVAACQQCGRYACQLCAVDFGGVVRCPGCAAGGPVVARTDQPEIARTLYDSIALTLPLASLILWPLTAVAAPSALTLAIVKWRAPLSLIRRSRWRFMLAILISVVEIGLWIWFIGFIVIAAKKGLLQPQGVGQ